jgi:hypothetical protein
VESSGRRARTSGARGRQLQDGDGEAARGVDGAVKLGTGATELPQMEVHRSRGCRDGLLTKLEAGAHSDRGGLEGGRSARRGRRREVRKLFAVCR